MNVSHVKMKKRTDTKVMDMAGQKAVPNVNIYTRMCAHTLMQTHWYSHTHTDEMMSITE